jgi:hypothetical protein
VLAMSPTHSQNAIECGEIAVDIADDSEGE